MASQLADALRMHKAKQEIRGERDRLLRAVDKRIDLNRFMRDDGKDSARHLLITVSFSIVGMLPYAASISLWFYTYHESLADTAACWLTLFCVGLLLCSLSKRSAVGKDRPWMWWLGVIWLQAAVVGLVIGFFFYFRSVAYYWKYTDMRSYTNVAAAQDSQAFHDGSMFLFTEDTRLDALRAVGYKSRWTGDTYCVAPLVDVTMSQVSSINYWAVGVNCCTARAGFSCGDAEDFSTRSALRVLEPTDVARPFMQWAMQDALYSKYMEAIQLEMATYYTKSSASPTLVHWSKDPISLKESYLSNAKDFCTQVSLGYFCVVVFFSYLVAWKLIPAKRAEGVLRDA